MDDEQAYITNLPLEVFDIILRNIDGLSLGRCRRVCKGWKELIESSDCLWHHKCREDFKSSSKIARRKSGNQCTWYHLYKNLTLWSNLMKYKPEVKKFNKFLRNDNLRALDIDYGLLPLRSDKCTIILNTSVLEHLTRLPNYTLPDRHCIRIANNDNVTIVQVKLGIYIQRTVASPKFTAEGFLKADGFVLTNNHLYYHYNKDVFELDLKCKELLPKFIVMIKYNIKEMQYSEHVIYIFTDHGFIVNLDMNRRFFDNLIYTLINCPAEWIKHIKHISAVDDKNFICYSRNLIKIEVGQCKHLYLEFPPITALFFYVDIILLGTLDGQILIYRLSSQTPGCHKPVFYTLARLPEGEVPLHLDVCERKTGPLIVASTVLQLYLVEYRFFPQEKQPLPFTLTRHKMDARMKKLQYRMKISNKNHDYDKDKLSAATN
ncbi:uncharacterized protein LOC120634920 [Pararge aegeria]|uniref:uncharacterized protein LOC120634920 n=1 Tax=Pararge aegeria TaxID=116150 RepID=UPI0019D10BA8|nr:uncharacterized protein LOC120634920 [Pararge aegeria]